MHGFSHFIGSSLGHEFAAPVVADAQRVVTYIKASHRPLALLTAIAKEQKVTTGLHTSNKTRFTSVHDCLQSVLDNERPLQAVVARHPDAFAAPRRGAADPKAIIQSRGFWSKLETLCTVMQPFSEVVMAVQSRTATVTGGHLPLRHLFGPEGEEGLHRHLGGPRIPRAPRPRLQQAVGYHGQAGVSPGALPAPSLSCGCQRAVQVLRDLPNG